MAKLFTMRLAGPIASLSGPRIDTVGDNLPIPTRSMITGIIGRLLASAMTSHSASAIAGYDADCCRRSSGAGTVIRDYLHSSHGLAAHDRPYVVERRRTVGRNGTGGRRT